MKDNEKMCELCGVIFEVNLKNKKSRNKRFCSGVCARRNNGLNNKGKKHTEEYKKQMSKRNSGEGNPFYGKRHSVESIDKMSLSSQWSEDKYRYCNMSDIEKEIFDGIMISDGSLTYSTISARLTLGFKYKQTLERIINDLKSLRFSKILEYESKPHKKTGKRYISFYTKSGFYRDLLEEYNSWYIDRIKVVPKELELTNLMCYWWFVCDGFISNNNVYLCTDSFNVEDLEILKEKLIDIGFNVSIRKNKRLFFNKKTSIEFLDWISNDINIQKEYLYKWNVKK